MNEIRKRNTIQHDRPAQPNAESRRDSMTRAAASVEVAGAEGGGSIDPSTRRGLNRALRGSLIRWTAGGAIAGGALGLVLSIAPGPFSTSAGVGAIAGAVVFAAAGAVIAFATGPLLTLEREDGRVEHEIEEATRHAAADDAGHRDEWLVEDAADADRAENEGYPLGREKAANGPSRARGCT